MTKIEQLKSRLKPGKVYRRSDLEKFTTSVDRDLALLVKEGTLNKLSQGIYHFPRISTFGRVPPDEKELIRVFLNGDDFLITSYNSYNSLGVGTTQLYNREIVYNHKRQGIYKLGNRKFEFRKNRFPNQLSDEFLVVDMINNINDLAEDSNEVIKNVRRKVGSLNKSKLKDSVKKYGKIKTRKILLPFIDNA